MIEISDPLPESSIGYRTVHKMTSDGKYIGYVDVGYLQEEDVKTFRRTKRRLRVGQPFGVQLFIDIEKSGVTASSLGRKGLAEIVEALETRFNGLEERDIYILELEGDRRKIIGRAPDIK